MNFRTLIALVAAVMAMAGAQAKGGATVLIVYAAASRFTALREQTGLEVDYCCLSPTTRTFALASAVCTLIALFR